MAIAASDVVTEYGSYYLDHGQSAQDLYAKLLRPSVTASHFRTVPTTETVKRYGTAELNRILQPFQKAFTPIGTTTFKPTKIELYELKIDMQEFPDDIADSWLSFLEGPGIKRADWPLVRWLMEVKIPERRDEDYELNEAYAGVFAAPTPGTAGGAGTAMDGIKQVMTALGARINTITMGAIPSADIDFCTYVEDYVKNHPIEYRRRIDNVYMNETLHLRYREGKRQKYNASYAQAADLDTLYHFPNVKVVGLPSHGASNKLWSTLPSNRLRLVKRNPKSLEVQEGTPRQVNIYGDWWEALNFQHPESVFKSDLA